MEVKGAGSLEIRAASDAARQEIESLKARAAELEAGLKREGVPQEAAPSAAAQQAVVEKWSREVSPQRTLDAQVLAHPEAFTLQLSPEEHDAQMGGVIAILQAHGVSRAIAAAEATGNAHLIDDFHRILVEYIKEGLPAKEADKRQYRAALGMTLYEVTLPGSADAEKPTDPSRAVHDYISLMEQFYRGMLQMDAAHDEYFSFEIANPAGAKETSLYVAVPRARKELFEKQLLSLYPAARLIERPDDYNAFAPGSQVAAAAATLEHRPIYSLRTYESFPNDPLDVLLNSFSKLDAAAEGAAVQFIVSPQDFGLLKKYRYALEQVRAGVPLKTATNIKSGAAGFFTDLFSSSKKLAADERPGADDPRIKNIEAKVASPILHANIRIVASAATGERAQAILGDIEGPFRQFTDTAGNGLEFAGIPARKLRNFVHAFSYRTLDAATAMPLSAAELATLAHMPGAGSKVAAPELRQESASVSAPPAALPSAGAVLGVNRFRGATQEVRLSPEDRLRHLYVIGQTGTGKSTLLKNVIIQDIEAGAGLCMIDPHGSDVLDILSRIPENRMQDVIYFDPGATDRPMALNMLEYDESRPEQKTLVVDELLGIFKKLFGAVPESMGPAFEQYFRNAALLVMEDPASGNTLLDIARIFSDGEFRARKLAACRNPIVSRFWQDIAMKASGDQGLENYAPYVTNKFDAFTTNEIVRPIIAQQKSSFNFRELMDTKKILLVNLAKGRIGDLNANLLGLVIVGKFLIAALSRADSVGKDLPPFYLHIDEFQNFTTPSIAAIFSEARKYKLSLTVAHQFIAQLTDEIRDAVFGNVGSLCAFRVGATDAEFLEKQFAPTFKAADLMNIDNRNAYLKLLINGKPSQPFNIETLPFEPGHADNVAQMQELSSLKYGRSRAEVEAEVAQSLAGAGMTQEPASLAASGI
ncbi:MAG TPA: DUF87 domain-containing protein [Candidatus Paceibacterota bacterium]|nr:DUF87 domain-containing protein [Candidatus Paceibacterota bacterium]